MTASPDQSIREHVLALLKGGSAHATFDDAIADFPAELRGKKAAGLPYTAWMLLEHMRLAQWDILQFSRSAEHVSPEFPEAYWPQSAAPPSDAAWDESVKSFRAELAAMQELVSDSKTDLYARIRWGDGQTILREALLIADHNAYHLGELIVLRRLLGAWK